MSDSVGLTKGASLHSHLQEVAYSTGSPQLILFHFGPNGTACPGSLLTGGLNMSTLVALLHHRYSFSVGSSGMFCSKG